MIRMNKYASCSAIAASAAGAVVRCGAWHNVQAAARAYDLAALALASERDGHYHKGLNFSAQQYAGVELPDLSKLPGGWGVLCPKG